MDKKNKAPTRYKKVNNTTGAEVKQSDIVKAYKLGKSMVIMEEDDFKKPCLRKPTILKYYSL